MAELSEFGGIAPSGCSPDIGGAAQNQALPQRCRARGRLRKL